MLGAGYKVTLFKLSPSHAGPSAGVATPALWGGDAEHKARWPCPTSFGCQILSDLARLTGLGPALASAPWLGRRIWVVCDVPKHYIGSKAWHGPEIQTWELRCSCLCGSCGYGQRCTRLVGKLLVFFSLLG